MKHDTENYIIAAWLIGDRLDDLNLVVPSDFKYGNNPGIVRMLQAKRTNLDIMREYGEDYRYLISIHMPSVYNAAFAELVEDIRWRVLQSGGNIKSILEMMQILDHRLNGIGSGPIIQRNLLATWEKEKEELRQNGQCEYGIGELDKLTGGIFRGHLIALAARPGGGKSALALQIASSIAFHERKKVVYFSLEMGINEQLDRLLMQHVGVMDSNRLKQGDLALTEIQAFRNKITEIERDQLLLFSTERTIERIESAIVSESPFLIVIDQLTQLQFANRDFANDLERYKAVTRYLKMLTNMTGVTIMLLCQLNRNAEGREPELYHLKDSGSIEEDSDDVLMIYKEPGQEQYEVDDPLAPSFRHLKIAKQRSGTTAIIKKLTFDPSSMTIYEYKSTL